MKEQFSSSSPQKEASDYAPFRSTAKRQALQLIQEKAQYWRQVSNESRVQSIDRLEGCRNS